MDTPEDSKYGFTREQLFEGFRKLKAYRWSWGASSLPETVM